MKPTAFLVLLIIYSVECSKILVVFQMASPSHFFLGNALARGLAEAGHDVTMVSPFEDTKPTKNGTYRNIVLTGFIEERDRNMGFNAFDMEHMNILFMIPFINKFGYWTSKNTLGHPNIQKLLKSDEHFDVVIMEQFANDALKVFAYHYKPPLILFSTIGANSFVNNVVGNPAPPSYVSESILGYTSNMTFKQRLVNWSLMALSELNMQVFFLLSQKRVMRKFFPDAPDLDVLNRNVSMVFLNSHESINQPVPHVPNMIDVGGFHVKPAKELPKDLKYFMDTATEGVVYFSMGSNIKPSQMPDDKRDAILAALGKLKQKVLWKWDEDTLPGKPSNVKLSKWFPQQDILAHPNTKLFITHGGLLSTIDTIYHGVPILAFPIFGDQKMNAARAQVDGYGLTMAFSEITEAKLTDALNKLLNDSEYMENAKRRSRLMHDRPVKPLDLAIYWTEFVIRHKGAPHLRVAGVDLPLYKYLLLDVISFVLLISVSSIIILCIIIRKLCCARRKTEHKFKKN